ncbi:MAG TPA: hypothetical protein VK659_23815 [Asanoa sp.]|nr:hypothetical protein [Asanoa sp.]
MDVSDSTFNAYVIALAVSGVIQLVIAGVGFGAGKGMRILSGLFGVGFLAYSIYLAFIFDGVEFRMFYYAFIAPILFIVQIVRARGERAKQAA